MKFLQRYARHRRRNVKRSRPDGPGDIQVNRTWSTSSGPSSAGKAIGLCGSVLNDQSPETTMTPVEATSAALPTSLFPSSKIITWIKGYIPSFCLTAGSAGPGSLISNADTQRRCRCPRAECMLLSAWHGWRRLPQKNGANERLFAHGNHPRLTRRSGWKTTASPGGAAVP